MNELTSGQLRDALIRVAALIVDNEARLTELDCLIGDGDHGIGMKTGFSALMEALSATEPRDMGELLKLAGVTLIRVMGGASGVIFGTLFTSGLEQVCGKEALTAQELVLYLEAGFYGIVKRGRSCLGSKTMLDALYPAIEGMKGKLSETGDLREILKAGYQGALAGVENTKDMVSVTGRSKNFRLKSLGIPDPGAVSVSIIFEGLYQWAEQNTKER
ncbi:MAG: dihydroxyacetone kinase subunit DhaL [Bacillota bacterium]